MPITTPTHQQSLIELRVAVSLLAEAVERIATHRDPDEVTVRPAPLGAFDYVATPGDNCLRQENADRRRISARECEESIARLKYVEETNNKRLLRLTVAIIDSMGWELKPGDPRWDVVAEAAPGLALRIVRNMEVF